MWQHVFSFLLGKYLGVEVLGCMESICLIRIKMFTLFSKMVFYILNWEVLKYFTFHQQCMMVPVSNTWDCLSFHDSPPSGYRVRGFWTERIYSSFQSEIGSKLALPPGTPYLLFWIVSEKEIFPFKGYATSPLWSF